MAQEFPLPDVGEGLTEAEIVSWKVKPGDTVTVNQVLVEIETAKSLVELPSPFAGTVTELLFEEGATVEVGAPIIRVASSGGTIELQAPSDGDVVGEVADPKASAEAEEAEEAEKPGAVLVGYGSKGGHATTRRRRPGVVTPTVEGATADGAKASARRPTTTSTSRPSPARASAARSCAKMSCGRRSRRASSATSRPPPGRRSARSASR
jgi:pyruvate dehydrogenase E2 component (dihydrolipoamide acetyltransferase)